MAQTVIPLSNNPLSDINVYSGYATTPQGGRALGLDLRQNVKDIINNVSKTQIFTNPSYGTATSRFYRLGRLNLPIGGNRAIVSINLCFGWGLNTSGLTNQAQHHIPNYNMMVHLHSSTPTTSRAVFLGSLGAPSSSLYNDVNYSLFHNGFVIASSPFVNP